MLVDVFNMEGQKVSTVELPPSVFEAPIYKERGLYDERLLKLVEGL